MENIPSSFIGGYSKKAVNKIISEKNSQLNKQQKDIDYLRSEITKLEKKLIKQNDNDLELEKE